jgi:hypothetical protein
MTLLYASTNLFPLMERYSDARAHHPLEAHNDTTGNPDACWGANRETDVKMFGGSNSQQPYTTSYQSTVTIHGSLRNHTKRAHRIV